MSKKDNDKSSEKDEHLFNFLVVRSQARMTATLAIATIASSASMVLFILILQNPTSLQNLQSENAFIFVLILGISFPLMGFAYYEITIQTIQSNDLAKIRELLYTITPNRTKEEIDEILLSRSYHQSLWTGVIWRSMMALPILVWVSLPFDFSLFVIIPMLLITGTIIIKFQHMFDVRKPKINPENS